MINFWQTAIAAIAIVIAGSVARAESREAEKRPTRVLQDDGRSNWEAVEAARDRGAGRIVDEHTWEIERLEADRRRRYLPGGEIRRFDEERDRELRIERRERKSAKAEQATKDEASIVRDTMAARAGLSPLALQVYEDERTLAATRAELRQTITALEVAEARELKRMHAKLKREDRQDEWPAMEKKIRADYARWRQEAEEEHDRVIGRVLGESGREGGSGRSPESAPPPAAAPRQVAEEEPPAERAAPTRKE